MDIRTKVYPSLPKGLGPRIVLPRIGDLRYRSQIPTTFVRCLYIHADPRRRFWYTRFQLKRKFIVMSTQGDVYVKTSVTAFALNDLPNKNVLSIPRMARGDLVKVLDFAQCSRSEGQQWEIVLMRWRTGMETWLPLEVVNFFAPNLLQEFYVNSINSWGFHSRVLQGNLQAFQTEVELWIFHPEFVEFYKKLSQKRVNKSMSQSQQQAVLASDPAHVKPERLASSAPPLNSLPAPFVPCVTQQAASAASATSDPPENLIREFEQRRLAKEHQEQLELTRQMTAVNLHLQQQQARDQAKRLENERRLQHEQQRQKVREELQKRQKEYQQRLRAQQDQEKVLEIQRKEQERQNREKDQEDLRCTLMQNKSYKAQSSQESSNHLSKENTSEIPLQRIGLQSDDFTTSASHRTKPNNSHLKNIWAKNGDDEYIPPDSSSESNISDASADSEVCEDIQPRKRRRKRLLYSQVELEDEDDYELPELSQPPQRGPRRIVSQSNCPDDSKSVQQREVRDKSDQFNESGMNSSRQNIDLTRHSDSDNEEGSHVELQVPTVPIASKVLDAASRHCEAEFFDDVDDDDDDDDDDDGDIALSNTYGEIRCPCGITLVGKYRGQWLQCWNKECSVWEHADCVGFLSKFENLPPRYLCSRCQPESYQARCVKASRHIMDWLFQCCDSRNLKQVMKLLKSDTEVTNFSLDSKNTRYENRTLAMHAARNGLTKCLHYLVVERRIDIFATDLHSRNVLHHAVHGESIACCRFLLKHNEKLLLHPDSRGCMPFHYMLQSTKVNKLSIHFMQNDTALIGMKDLDSNFPIHYACQAINRYTARICQIIFAARSSMVFQKSSEGLNPIMILCKTVTNSMRQKTSYASEVGKSTMDVISLMLEIDVFGDCLNQRATNGWFPLHFAAASGCYDLITRLCKAGLFDVNLAAKGSGQTALHVAAQENYSLSIRALLLEGLNVVAKDNDGRIPLLCTLSVSCVQELMHYKLAQQLSTLQQMQGKYPLRGLVRQWQRIVASEPTCFDILNDWCQIDIKRIEQMEGLLLSNPFLLRLDNKIKYVRMKVIPSIKSSSSIDPASGKPYTDTHLRGQRKLKFVFSREGGCFWKQFVKMGKCLEPEDFRMPMIFSIEHSGADNQGTDDNLKLILIHLAAGLRKEVPGLLLTRESTCSYNLDDFFLSYSKQDLGAKLLEFYLLGELAAHFVLFAVSMSGIFDFDLAFLRCISCNGKHQLARYKLWKTAGSSFVSGFEAVLPATLELFHAKDLRVLFNGPEAKFNALQIDWSTAVNWKIFIEDKNCANSAMIWLPRLVSELVSEDQQLLLLFMAETYQLINDRFFRSEGEFGRITIASFPETDGELDHDAMYPIMEYNTDTLRLPSYSCYEAFKKGLLTVIRHTDRAFLPD